MVTLDQRVEAMMILANKNRKRTDGRMDGRMEGRYHDSPERVRADSYRSYNPDTAGDSPETRDSDSLIRNTSSRQNSTKRRTDPDDDDNCLIKCGRCLAQVPCATMCCWVFMATAVAMNTGGVLVAFIKGQDMFGKDVDLISLVMWVCIGVLLGMIFMGTLFLIVACISSGKLSRKIFNSSKKNVCARVLNGFVMVLMVVLQLAWIVAAALLALPLATLCVVQYLYHVQEVPCVNLQYYGMSRTERLVCHRELELMMQRSPPVLIALCFAILGAVFTIISMTFFILCASSNMMYLRESRFATYNVNQNGNRGSLGSHQDTKM